MAVHAGWQQSRNNRTQYPNRAVGECSNPREGNMEAIRVHEFGGSEVMKLEDVPDLQPEPG